MMSGVEWSSAQMHTSTCVRHESRKLVSNEVEGSYGQGAAGAVKAYTPPSREPTYTTPPVMVKERMPEK